MTDKTLKQLYEQHKGKTSDKWSLYLDEYQRIFCELRDQPVRILEIGVQNGGSLEIWGKYFKSARKIVGCDWDSKCGFLRFDDSRVSLVIGNANSDDAEKKIEEYSAQFDIVIDDGSHKSEDIICSFARYFPKLVEGGIYIAEDLHCSYWGEFDGGLYAPFSSMAFFKRLSDILNFEHWGTDAKRSSVLEVFFEEYDFRIDEASLETVHSVEFMNSLCVIKKSHASNNALGQRLIQGTEESVSCAGQLRNLEHDLALSQMTNPFATRNAAFPEGFLELWKTLIRQQENAALCSQRIAGLEEKIKQQDRTATIRESHLQKLNQEFHELVGHKETVEKALCTEKELHARMERMLERARTTLAAKEAHYYRTTLSRNMHVEQLEKSISALKASMSWKVTSPLRAVHGQFRLLRESLVMGGGMSATVKLTLGVLRHEGWSGIRWRLLNARKSLVGESLLPPPTEQQASPSANSQAADKKNGPIKILKKEKLEIKPAKLICFYLPQFHRIPENDKWWGEGFTEWTNVRPALKYFDDHYQPRVPGDLGYYDLSDTKTLSKQVELAKLYGIDGFCFYFYWFNGKRLLEKPTEAFLDNRELNISFCLCWANENWSRRWDGLENEILISQNHSAEDDTSFIEHVSNYMRDPRYIRVDGKPLLMVYRPGLLPSALETATLWRKWCRENGLGEIYLAYTQSFDHKNPSDFGFDAAIEFPPANSAPPDLTGSISGLKLPFNGKVYDWSVFPERSDRYEDREYKLYRGVCPSWDNTARRKDSAHVFVNNSPQLYQKWLFNAINDSRKRAQSLDERLVFINAWNEWAEGAYLEPDLKHGYAYLEATRMALVRASASSSELPFVNETLAIVVHAFYLEVFFEILEYIDKLDASNYKIYITTIRLNKSVIESELKKRNVNFLLLEVENKGRDVLPFIKIFKHVVDARHRLLIKVHTKKSIHRDDGEKWRMDFYRSLLDPVAIEDSCRRFEKESKLGMVAPPNHIVPMEFYCGSNLDRIAELAARMGLNTAEFRNISFVAGTMYIARVAALLPLDNLALDDDDFEEELGQLDGTMAHALERCMAVAVQAAGYKISAGRSEPYHFAERIG